MTIYTPGGTHGQPLAVLRSFTAPSEVVRADADALGDRVTSAVSGLLSLVGDHADPLQSRDHILLSRILYDRWVESADLDLGGLIRAVQNPGFDRIGVLDLESFFPERERFKLAARLNNLVAAPGFDAWLKGDPLDIGRLLWTAEGKPRISILSIAHLNDAERQFFLTMLLNEVVAWMRSQSGSSSLRAILYIDEVFGYLPPTAMPPTKTPLLTLLKQARAFGLGIVLATQNPVDLDYKALSNIGTWFLGRLQTERDKKRVLDGLEGSAAMSGSGGLSRRELDVLLSALDSRVFLVPRKQCARGCPGVNPDSLGHVFSAGSPDPVRDPAADGRADKRVCDRAGSNPSVGQFRAGWQRTSSSDSSATGGASVHRRPRRRTVSSGPARTRRTPLHEGQDGSRSLGRAVLSRSARGRDDVGSVAACGIVGPGTDADRKPDRGREFRFPSGRGRNTGVLPLVEGAVQVLGLQGGGADPADVQAPQAHLGAR